MVDELSPGVSAALPLNRDTITSLLCKEGVAFRVEPLDDILTKESGDSNLPEVAVADTDDI
jgi:hypothetical protein